MKLIKILDFSIANTICIQIKPADICSWLHW